VVSRDYFEAAKLGLRDYLWNSGYADDHDEFDNALQAVRERGGAFIAAAH
jgi:hypothetical protein